MNKKILVLLCIIITTICQLHAQTITTAVGGGIGDGGPATAAYIHPSYVLMHNGCLYISEYKGRIRKIDEKGRISTIAGNEMQSSKVKGMGGQATATSLEYPAGMAFDAAGNLIFADGSLNAILKITPSGIITRIAGTDTFGYNGDNIPATSAMLRFPMGLAIDKAGNIYIADEYNNRIRKISNDGIITTIAGGNELDPVVCRDGLATAAKIERPTDVATDGHGNLYFMSEFFRPCKINSAGILSQVIVNDTSIKLKGGGEMAIDRDGKLLMLNRAKDASGSTKLYKIDTFGNIALLAGSDTARYAIDSVGVPATGVNIVCSGLTLDDAGNFYLASNNGLSEDKIYKINTENNISTFAGAVGTFCDGAPADNAMLNFPKDVVRDRVGNMYISDYKNKRIRKVNTEGTINNFANIQTRKLAVDTSGNVYFEASFQVKKIDQYGVITTVAGSDSGGYSGDGGPATLARLFNACDIIVDRNNNLYIADRGNMRVRKVDNNGIISTFAGNGLVASTGNGGPATEAATIPIGITVDRDDNLLILEVNKIRKVSGHGIISTLAIINKGRDTGSGQYMRIDLFLNNKITADTAGNTYGSTGLGVQKIDANGIVTTIAGTDTVGYSGDNGPATAARLNRTSGLCVDDSGSVYVADEYNSRIRKINTKYNYPTPKSDTGFQFHLYPNPTTGTLHIKYNTGTAGEVSLRIYDAKGRTFHTTSFASATGNIDETIDLPPTVPPGVYFLQLKTIKGTRVSTFVVLHN